MQVEMTPAAEKFIRRMLSYDGKPGYGFRLVAAPGGCSGLSAEFSVEAEPRAGEQVFEIGGIRLFLPAQSRLLLDGATIDFVDTPASMSLVIHQPNFASTCESGAGPDLAPALHRRH